jgi:hypothetical protein
MSTVIFISLSIASLISFSGFGILLNNKKEDFLLNIIFGYLISGILITFIHFFFAINLIVVIIIFMTGFILSIKNYNFLIQRVKKKFFFFFLVFLILIPIFISQKYHEDFGYYHLPYIVNLASEKIIFGLGNINDGFIHNSIWLNVISLFYFGNNYNFVTLPTFFLYFIFIIYSVNEIINYKKHYISNYFLIICIFYLILKFTRISEFGNDIPSLIYSILGIFFFLKYEEEDNSLKKKNFFFRHLSFVAFAILIKFSVIPIIILTLFIFFRDFKVIGKEIFKYNYFIIYFLVIIFFCQQFIYTGCFVFPSKISCLDVSWFNNDFLNLGTNLELVNKSYSIAQEFISRDEYLLNFNWVPYWFERNYPEIIEHLSTMLIPIFIFLLLSKNNNNNINNTNNINYLKVFVLFLVIGFIFWFTLSPVYRFGILYFLCLIFIFTIPLYKKKIFSKKIFLTLLCLFLTFNFSKNISRIIQKNYIVFGIDNVNNEYIIYDDYIANKTISVFRPNIKVNNLNGNGWQGRLCWDIPFICSYNKIKVNLISNYYVISKLN